MKKIYVFAIATIVCLTLIFSFIYSTTSLIDACSVRVRIKSKLVEVETEVDGCSEERAFYESSAQF